MFRQGVRHTLRTSERVPPGQHLVTNFPVLHAGPVPPFDPQTWRLRIFGLVEEEKTYTYEALTAPAILPVSTVPADFHCVPTWSKLDTVWAGVKVTDRLAQLPVQPHVQQFKAKITETRRYSPGGYNPIAGQRGKEPKVRVDRLEVWQSRCGSI